MPKKKHENDKDKDKGNKKGKKGQRPPVPANPSQSEAQPNYKLTPADISKFRRDAGDASEHLSDDDIHMLAESAHAMGRALGFSIDKSLLMELLKSQLDDMLLGQFDDEDDDEDDDGFGDSEEVDASYFQENGEDDDEQLLNDWESFAAENFPADFFAGTEALEDVEAIKDKGARKFKIAGLCERYPQHGQLWLELARLESNPDKARDCLHQALQANRWMLSLAKEFPDYAEGMQRAYVMFGLDVAGEFWMSGQRTDALEIHENLLKIESRDVGGQRLLYAFRLFEQGWFDELDEQIAALEKESQSEAAIWLLKAFVLFVREQDFGAASVALKKSKEINPLTFDTLLGGLDLDDVDELDQAAPEVEAHWIGRVAMAPAASVDGLHRWMRDVLDYAAPSAEDEESDHWEDRLSDLLKLPQRDAEWFLESRPIDNGYVTVIGETEELDIIGFDQQDRMLNSDELWEILVDTMEYPEIEEPCRPNRLVVTVPSLVEAWKKNCESLEIEIAFREDLQVPDDLFDFVSKGMSIAAEEVELDDATLEAAADLERSGEIWVVGAYRPPIWITDSATPRRPWMNVVVNNESGLVRMQEMSDDVPADDFLAKTVVKAIFMSMVPDEEPCLPSEIHICSPGPHLALSRVCEHLDISLVESDDDGALISVIDSIVEMSSPPDLRTAIHESAELDADELGSLYRDLALFYRAALWRSTHRDQYLEVVVPALERSLFYVKLIGQLGDFRGLYVGYQEEAFHEKIDDIPDPQLYTSTILNFDEAYSLCPTDLLVIERNGFEIAGENAFPLIQHCFAEQSFRRPDRDEVIEIQIAVRAVMALAERPHGNDTEKLTLPTINGPMEVGLRWIHF